MKITSEKHFQEIIQTKAIILFSADYCGECLVFKPHWETVKAEHPDMPLFSLDTQEFLDLAQKEGIVSIPTVRFYANGINNATLKEYTFDDLSNFVQKTLF